jgi:hypothetical protein
MRCMLCAAVAALTVCPSLPVHAQGRVSRPAWTPPQLVLGEHATGGEVPLAIAAVSLAGFVVHDIVTAPSSARWHNQQYLNSAPKSGTTAILLSATSTVVPVVLGASMGSSGGVKLAAAGVAIGPSVGHWYAGRKGRGFRSFGIRSLLLISGLALEACCT